MKTLRNTLILLVLAGAAVGAYVKFVDVTVPPQIMSMPASRGEISENVVATGTLQATRTVDVGTQVSGVVKRMYVDYNSIVKKGELIAEIDPQLSEAALNSAKASYDKSTIDLSGAQAQLKVDTDTRDREESLFKSGLATESDKETSELTVKQDQATVDQDQAAVVIAKAGVAQAQVNLDFCTIRSPIDGVVVQRNADEGQTVATSMAVPSLYVMATDVTHLELSGQVDEADIGKLHPGQDVAFTVDAYPNRTFHGEMTHVRLYATTTNNVVTYQAIVSVKNDDLRLLPSMTANMKVQVAHLDNVVRVPNTALRFRPSHDDFDALGQTPPPTPAVPLKPATPPPPIAAPARPLSAAGTAMLPDSTSTTPMIDTLFTDAPIPQSTAQVWVVADGHLKMIPVTVGLTDGTWSQLISGDIEPGQELVTAVLLPAKRATSSANPLVPTRGGPGGGPGGGGGGGRTGR